MFFSSRAKDSTLPLIEHFGSMDDFQKYTERKGKETLIEHYGSLENAYKVSHIKSDNTKRIKCTFNTSKPEEKGYKLLYNKFGFCNVKRQYRTKLYPFACDFYIKSLDTYIEFNFLY